MFRKFPDNESCSHNVTLKVSEAKELDAVTVTMPTMSARRVQNECPMNPMGLKQFFLPEQFERLRKLMVPVRAAAGSYLILEGDPTGKLYYVISGTVKLRKSTEDGKTFLLSLLQSDDLLYESSDETNLTHSFSAEVSEDAELGVLYWSEFEALLSRDGDFAIRFMKWLALSHRATKSKFRDLLLYGKPGALASTLIRLANSYGIACADGIRISVKLTNAEIADFIGTTRESVNRMLNGLKEDDIIDVKNGRIVIRELSALRAICNCPDCPGCAKEICRI
ncbi:Crp/Fnr family transcriptional regulator [Cohnella soli]|uniref:Crp/Fnr family transcriptional regulator n=1 Tax=Cohnella soli TaxID=425005 RepID=A0ABW0I0R1_9BACL